MNYAVKILCVLWWLSFVFPGGSFSEFSKFPEDMAKLDKSNLRETWVCDIQGPKFEKTGKSGLKFCKLIFIAGIIEQTVYKFSKI